MGDYTDLDELECPLVARSVIAMTHSNPHLLTHNRVIPSRYRLSIFDIQSQIPWLYSGEVDIRANITSPSDTINIHADSLDIQAAVVHLQNGSSSCDDFSCWGQTDGQISSKSESYTHSRGEADRVSALSKRTSLWQHLIGNKFPRSNR